jgi:hypothetical protein
MGFDEERKKVGRQPITIIEMDLDFCNLTYSISPCTASLDSPATGTRKCYNTFKTCQDIENYDPSPKTYRFSEKVSNYPVGINMIPCISNIRISPTKLDINGGLGQRETVDITMSDFPFSDRWIGLDKYVNERNFDTENNGTFWGKFLARNPFYQGRSLRVRVGYVTDPWDWDNFENRNYIIDQIDGPDAKGKVRIVAKDVLSLAVSAKALAPAPSKGKLSSGISDTATSLTLSPSGIGDSEYPTSGKLRISDEVMDYSSRTGDVVSGITRGVNNTTAKAHSANDTVQLCKVYTNKKAYEITEDLLKNFAGIDPSFIDSAKWQLEDDTFINNLYNTETTEPTGVEKLIKELAEQAGFYIWPDTRFSSIEFRAIKPPPASAVTLTDDDFIENSLRVQQNEKERLNQVLVYFGRINPTEKLDEEKNYSRLFIDPNLISQGPNAFDDVRSKTIFSRWILKTDEPAVTDVTDRILKLFEFPPIIVTGEMDANRLDVWVGDYVKLQIRLIQNDTGAKRLLNMLVEKIQENQAGTKARYTLREQRTAIFEPGTFEMFISENVSLYNLKEEFDLLFGETLDPIDLVVTIQSGVVVSGESFAGPSFDTGLFPFGSTIRLINNGRIQGTGGDGGSVRFIGGNYFSGFGGGGRTALKVQSPITLENNGEVWGGGGGGGPGFVEPILPPRLIPINAGGGGGGAGSPPGQGGTGGGSTPGGQGDDGEDGTTELGGGGGGGTACFGGDGGDPGEDGADGGCQADTGGDAGEAVDGDSLVTYDPVGDIKGPQIN